MQQGLHQLKTIKECGRQKSSNSAKMPRKQFELLYRERDQTLQENPMESIIYVKSKRCKPDQKTKKSKVKDQFRKIMKDLDVHMNKHKKANASKDVSQHQMRSVEKQHSSGKTRKCKENVAKDSVKKSSVNVSKFLDNSVAPKHKAQTAQNSKIFKTTQFKTSNKHHFNATTSNNRKAMLNQTSSSTKSPAKPSSTKKSSKSKQKLFSNEFINGKYKNATKHTVSLSSITRRQPDLEKTTSLFRNGSRKSMAFLTADLSEAKTTLKPQKPASKRLKLKQDDDQYILMDGNFQKIQFDCLSQFETKLLSTYRQGSLRKKSIRLSKKGLGIDVESFNKVLVKSKNQEKVQENDEKRDDENNKNNNNNKIVNNNQQQQQQLNNTFKEEEEDDENEVDCQIQQQTEYVDEGCSLSIDNGNDNEQEISQIRTFLNSNAAKIQSWWRKTLFKKSKCKRAQQVNQASSNDYTIVNVQNNTDSNESDEAAYSSLKTCRVRQSLQSGTVQAVNSLQFIKDEVPHFPSTQSLVLEQVDLSDTENARNQKQVQSSQNISSTITEKVALVLDKMKLQELSDQNHDQLSMKKKKEGSESQIVEGQDNQGSRECLQNRMVIMEENERDEISPFQSLTGNSHGRQDGYPNQKTGKMMIQSRKKTQGCHISSTHASNNQFISNSLKSGGKYQKKTDATGQQYYQEETLGGQSSQDSCCDDASPHKNLREDELEALCRDGQSHAEAFQAGAADMNQLISNLKIQQHVKNCIDKRVAFQMGGLSSESAEMVVDTSILGLHQFLINFFKFYLENYKDEFLRLINMPYGYSTVKRLQFLQGYADDSDELIQDQNGMIYGLQFILSDEVLDEFFEVYYGPCLSDQTTSAEIANMISLIKIHSKAVFDAFNQALNSFRPYFAIGGPPYLWNCSEAALTFYFISEENIDEVFEKTQYKVLKWAASLTGLIVDQDVGKTLLSSRQNNRDSDCSSLTNITTSQPDQSVEQHIANYNDQQQGPGSVFQPHPLLLQVRQERAIKQDRISINENSALWNMFEEQKTALLYKISSVLFEQIAFEIASELTQIKKQCFDHHHQKYQD